MKGWHSSVKGKTLAEFPEIAAFFHPTKNGDLHPSLIKAGSHSKLWWKCPEGPDHEWQTSVLDRTRQKTGCPFCDGKRVSVTNSLASRYPPIATEWHPTKNGHLKPQDVVAGSNKKVWWKCGKGPDHEWQASVDSRALRGRGCPFCAGYRVSITNSLASRFPEISDEWHPTKNGDLLPTKITYGSRKKVWWRCPIDQEHEWRAEISNRTHNKAGCPICAGRRLGPQNSLSAAYPEIAKEWHPTRNGSTTPEQILSGSMRVVWWKCNQGPDHVWRASVQYRTRMGRNCPFCAGHRASVTNSLKTRYPSLAEQWHPTLNGDLLPSAVASGTGKKVWWKCSAGPDHEWKAPVNARTNSRQGCPFCSGKRVSITNSLLNRFPKTAAQWHPTKNISLTPEQITYGSKNSVWWKCPGGPDHEWKMSANDRTANKKGCPFCAGKRVSKTNSLAACFPKIAWEWHPKKNGHLTPWRITFGSRRRVWWKCQSDKSHVWIATVSDRTGKGSGCPWCRILPRSKEEILLAFELKQFIDFDIEEHKLPLEGIIEDVDILIRAHRLVVEFDGNYWHRNRLEYDTAKTTRLSINGWKVIRIRQIPLEPITSDDIIVAPNVRLKTIANQILIRIQEVCNISMQGFDAYLARKTLSRKQEAEDYVRKLAERT